MSQDSYSIKTANKKIIFSYNENSFTSSGELGLDKNHVVVSIDTISTIYINKVLSETSGSFSSFGSSGQLIVGNINNLMIFNKSLSGLEVNGLYNSQLG